MTKRRRERCWVSLRMRLRLRSVYISLLSMEHRRVGNTPESGLGRVQLRDVCSKSIIDAETSFTSS